MDPIVTASDVKLAGSAAKSVLGLAKELTALIKQALATPDLQQRVLLYLRAAQEAVRGLGMERQQILADARRCSVEDARQTFALWERMDTYLHQDHIRPNLLDAIAGLRGCKPSILAEAQKFSWRKKGNKRLAAESFIHTLTELEQVYDRLSSNFYPGGSAMGVQPLIPIYDLLARLCEDHKHKNSIDYDAEYAKLGNLIRKALRHKSHEAWLRSSGQVERLIAELHLAFRWTEHTAVRAGSARDTTDRGSGQSKHRGKIASDG